MNQVLNSSTLSDNLPAAVDLFYKSLLGFCYCFESKQGHPSIDTPTIQKDIWFPINEHLHKHLLSPCNYITKISMVPSPNIQLCGLSASEWNTNVCTLMFGYASKSAETHNANIPQIPLILNSTENRVRSLLLCSYFEAFDVQASYNLTDAFTELIKQDGKTIINALSTLINEKLLRDDLICEALVSIGRLLDANTEGDRFNLLVSSLDHPAPIVRDGAIMGLAFMDNKKAIPYLRKASAKESLQTLRGNIEVAIKDIETP